MLAAGKESELGLTPFRGGRKETIRRGGGPRRVNLQREFQV